MKEDMRVWFNNALNSPFRLMAQILRKRGWVVFYLDKESRNCSKGFCWLKEYQQIIEKEG
jgi:hypothetical protein